MTHLLVHPRPWRLADPDGGRMIWIQDASGQPFLCVGPAEDRASHDEAARIVAAVAQIPNPLPQTMWTALAHPGAGGAE